MSLNEIVRREVGEVPGKRLLHLQCHFGMDTMSWARLGAKATGIDFSDAAIDLARSLNDELGLTARFLCSSVYDLPEALDEQFDIVFTSEGVLCWLPDLDRWAEVVCRFLRPGGVFYIFDGHPVRVVFEESEAGDMCPTHSYFHEQFFSEGNQPTYTGPELIGSPVYEWHHSLGEIVTALVGSGLTIEFLHEFAVSSYRAYPGMTKHDDGWWRFDKNNDSIPQMFSIRAARDST